MKVRLRSRILLAAARELGFGRDPFRQEEGGYLAGRFDGGSVQIVDFWRDQNAERTPASIRLRESHLDYVTERIEQTQDPSLYVVGTWHVHPPGYGPRYSGIDAEYLFTEHSAIRAGGLSNARLPQAHLILSWGDPYNYRVYGMRVDIPGLQRTATEPRPEHRRAIAGAIQQGCHAGVLRAGGTEPYSGPAIAEALAAGTLQGFFWLFPSRSIDEQVEQVYLANFLHHVRQAAALPSGGWARRPLQLLYYRLTRWGRRLAVTAQRLLYSTNEQAPQAVHMPCDVTEEMTVLLTNPDLRQGATVNLGAQSHTTVGELGQALQAVRGLKAAPILSACRPDHEAEHWRRRTVVDEFGEVVLPDDVPVAALIDEHSEGVASLLWRSPNLHPRLVYDLRTQRLGRLGYDQQRLADCTVLVAGLGLLGSELAPLLTAAGVGELLLLDHGSVDFTNIYRQRLYERKDVFQAKATVAARRLRGAGGKVEGHHLAIPALGGSTPGSRENLEKLDGLVARSSLVIGALDSYSARAVLQVLCLARGVPFLSLALDLFTDLSVALGSLFLALPGKPGCYACSGKLDGKHDSGVCTVAPLELPPIVGGLALRLALQVLQGRVSTPCRVNLSPALTVEQQDIAGADPQCEVCGPTGVVRHGEGDLYEHIQAWLAGQRIPT